MLRNRRPSRRKTRWTSSSTSHRRSTYPSTVASRPISIVSEPKVGWRGDDAVKGPVLHVTEGRGGVVAMDLPAVAIKTPRPRGTVHSFASPISGDLGQAHACVAPWLLSRHGGCCERSRGRGGIELAIEGVLGDGPLPSKDRTGAAAVRCAPRPFGRTRPHAAPQCSRLGPSFRPAMGMPNGASSTMTNNVHDQCAAASSALGRRSVIMVPRGSPTASVANTFASLITTCP